MYSLHHPSFNRLNSLFLISTTLSGTQLLDSTVCWLNIYVIFAAETILETRPFVSFFQHHEVKHDTHVWPNRIVSCCFFQNYEIEDCLPVSLRSRQPYTVKIFTEWRVSDVFGVASPAAEGRYDLEDQSQCVPWLLWFALVFWFLAKMPLIRILKKSHHCWRWKFEWGFVTKDRPSPAFGVFHLTPTILIYACIHAC